MRFNLFHLCPIALGLISGQVAAVGFGEITLHSRLGEPLRAEVSIVSASQEAVDTACFSLAPLKDADLPAITNARLRLVRDGQGYRLAITGTTPVSEPIFLLPVRAGCGIELQRDFVLMPQPPLAAMETPKPELTVSSGNASIGTDLPTGRQFARRQPSAAVTEENEMPPPAPKPKPRTPARSNPSPAPAKDRLLLGAAPADIVIEDDLVLTKDSALRRTAPEMEARLRHMEKTVGLLNEEISKLNQALVITSEVLAAQHKLQTAQGGQPVQATPVLRPAPPPPAKASSPAPAAPQAAKSDVRNWLELLISALGGGAIAALAAHLFSRRTAKRRSVAETLAFRTSVLQESQKLPGSKWWGKTPE